MSDPKLNQTHQIIVNIHNLLLQGHFPGELAPVINEGIKFLQQFASQLEEQINDGETSQGSGNETSSAGLGNGRVRNPRKRNRK